MGDEAGHQILERDLTICKFLLECLVPVQFVDSGCSNTSKCTNLQKLETFFQMSIGAGSLDTDIVA